MATLRVQKRKNEPQRIQEFLGKQFAGAFYQVAVPAVGPAHSERNIDQHRLLVHLYKVDDSIQTIVPQSLYGCFTFRTYHLSPDTLGKDGCTTLSKRFLLALHGQRRPLHGKYMQELCKQKCAPQTEAPAPGVSTVGIL